jgi:hypothetical protein
MYMNIVFDRVKERRDARVAKELQDAIKQEEQAKVQEERKKKVDEERARKAEDEQRRRAEKEAEKLRREEEKRQALEAEAARKAAIPDCAAVTKSGTPCKKKADGRGRFCIQHKGWRGMTVDELPENQKPKVKQSTAKVRQQVQVDEYKLWKKEERFVFMREKKEGYAAIFKVPDGKEVRYNKAKVPILRAAGEPDDNGA